MKKKIDNQTDENIELCITQWNKVQFNLFTSNTLEHKLRLITEYVEKVFDAYIGIWLIKEGDRCHVDCPYFFEKFEGVSTCKDKQYCLHLVSGSRLPSSQDKAIFNRIPHNGHGLGKLATNEHNSLSLCNGLMNNKFSSSHQKWITQYNIRSFAGFNLALPEHKSSGIMGVFSQHPISDEKFALMENISWAATRVIMSANMEKELEENQYYFGMTEEYAHIGLWMFDFTRNELIWSSGTYEILGAPLTQKPSIEYLFRHIHSNDIKYVTNAWADALNAEPIDIEFRIVLGKTEKWVNIRMGFEFDNNGKPSKGIGIIVDMTERKTLENEKILYREQLFKADKLKSLGILVSGVAHEINNPNLRIMLGLPVLKKAWEDIWKILKAYCSELDFFSISGMSFTEATQVIPELLENMENSSAQIKRIVNELKDYVVDKNSKLVLENCDLNKALKSAVFLLQNMINKSTDKFSIKYGMLPVIKGDINKLEQVFVNLIQNSCQALTDKNQKIQIRSFGDKNNNAIVEIKDEGIGMTSEDIEHLFEPFFTKKRDSGGIGLGLSISHKIIKEHSGLLSFDSNVNKGTVVKVVLPSTIKKP